MLILPIETQNHVEDVLVIILDDSNLERMATADPAEVILRETGRNLVNPSILVCHQNSTPEFAKLFQTRDVAKIVKYLQRGFKFRPEKGDHDNGPSSLAGSN